MNKTTVFSDKLFWKWVSSLIGGSNTDHLEFMSRMMTKERCFFGEDNTTSTNNSSIFLHLKKVMPRNYFQEMEYCALAYSTIFTNLFPPLSTHIEQLAYIEWLCYVEPENLTYRDHFLHMLKVAFEGQSMILENKSWLETIAKCQFDSEHFCAWCKNKNILKIK